MRQFSPEAQAISQVKGMAKAIQSGNALDMLGQSTPQTRQVSKYISDHGGDAEKAFYALAREKGVDPDSVLSQVKNYFKL